MEPPIILVNDWSDDDGHPVALRYIRGFNDIRAQFTYKQLEKLQSHPKCNHVNNRYGWPCKSCEEAFAEPFWSVCATILDYFADFYFVDTPGMQSEWYRWLDLWQNAALWLPCEEIVEFPQNVRPRQIARSAILFHNAYEEALDLLDKVTDGEKEAGTPTERFIYRASFQQTCGAGTYEPGGWRSGLKPWEQFLSARSPGVYAPIHTDHLTEAFRDGKEGKVNLERIRFVPQAAIAIVKNLTEHTRDLAVKLAEEEPEIGTDILKTFNERSLKFPTGSQTHSYTSMTGHQVTYQLTNGAPPVLRDAGYHDPDMENKEPDFQLLDEGLAQCMGVPAYVSRSGTDEEVEMDLVFDVWTVRESEQVKEDEGGNRTKPVVEGLDKMFDYWCEDDDAYELGSGPDSSEAVRPGFRELPANNRNSDNPADF